MSLTPLALVDTKIFFAGADLTGFSNKVDLPTTAEPLGSTTFGSGGWNERVGGLFDMQGSIEGFWQAGDESMPDDNFWTSLGTNAIPATFIPTGGTTDGDLAYVTKVFEARYDLSGQMGQLVAWAADLQGNAPVARGAVAVTSAARTATGTGTAVQMGAVGTAQRLYANLHVFAATGTSPTLAVKIQSASSSSFSSPTDRITFSTASAITGIPSSVVGNITDTWWRAVYTIAGTSPSFTFAVAFGVAAK